MDPEIMGAAGAVGGLSAIAQYYQSQKAAGANQAQLDQIKQMFEQIKPPQYDVSVIDPPQYISAKVPEAAVNYSTLTPQQFQLVGKFAPTVAQHIAEQNPTLAQNSQFGQAGKDAQVSALQDMMQRAKSTGMDPVLANQLQMASQKAGADAQSRQQSLMQNAQRKGQFGSGLQYASQMQAGSDAMNNEAQAAQSAAAQAYQAKIQALKDASNLGGQMQSQDFSQQARNADILNSFNQRTAANQNAYNQYSSGLMNNAQQYNLGQQQNISNQNTNLANQYQQYNRQQQNQGAIDAYNRQMGSVNAQNSLLNQNYQNQVGAQQRYNDLRSRQYSDQMNKAGAMSGLGAQQMNMNTQNAANTNQAIQGVTNAAMGGAMQYGQSQQHQNDQDFQAKQNSLDRVAYSRKYNDQTDPSVE